MKMAMGSHTGHPHDTGAGVFPLPTLCVMKLDTRYRKNNTIGNIKNMDSGHEASVPAVAAVIAAAVLLVVTIMMGLGSVPFPN